MCAGSLQHFASVPLCLSYHAPGFLLNPPGHSWVQSPVLPSRGSALTGQWVTNPLKVVNLMVWVDRTEKHRFLSHDL